MKKTAGMLAWEEKTHTPIETVLCRWGTDYHTIRELAQALSEKADRVSEGTAYLWLQRCLYSPICDSPLRKV